MAKDNQISMPGVFGGLMRYNEEYDSPFRIKPWTIIALIVLLGVSVIVLKILFPLTPAVSNIPTNLPPIGGHGLLFNLLI